MKYQVRDLRDKYFRIDNDIVDKYTPVCGPYFLSVYALLCRMADKDQAAFPSKKYLAMKLGIGERSVYRALRKLEHLDIIIPRKSPRSAGRFQSVTYYLTTKEMWKSPSAPQAVGSPSASQDKNRLPHRQTNKTHITKLIRNFENERKAAERTRAELEAKGLLRGGLKK